MCHILNRWIVLLHHIVLPMPEHFTSIHSVPPRRPPPRSPSAEHAGPCFPRVDCLLILNLRQVVKIQAQLNWREICNTTASNETWDWTWDHRVSSPYLLSLPPSPSNSLLPVSRTTTPVPECPVADNGLHYSSSLSVPSGVKNCEMSDTCRPRLQETRLHASGLARSAKKLRGREGKKGRMGGYMAMGEPAQGCQLSE